MESHWDIVPVKQEGFVPEIPDYTLDPNTEKGKAANLEAEKRPDNRFNDGKGDPRRFWAGTISTVKKPETPILHARRSQAIAESLFRHHSNGICWHSDASVMYYGRYSNQDHGVPL